MQLAGTFWTEIHQDPIINSAITARVVLEEQTKEDMETMLLCAGRETTPIYHRMLLYPLVLRRADKVDDSWPASEKLAVVHLITEKITEQKHTLFSGLDFNLNNGRIHFTVDPFTYLNNETENEELTLWLHDASFDENYLSDFWGYQLGLIAPSSQEYKDLLCEVYDTLIGGTSRLNVETIVSLFNGGTLAKTDETVILITEDYRGKFVATDKNIYRVNGKVIVKPGNVLQKGDHITDTCQFYKAVDIKKLPALTIPKGLFFDEILSDLTFINKDVPVTINNGFISFDVIGEKEDVAKFFVAFNKCLVAKILRDKTTVNPLKLILSNVLKYNTLICLTKFTNKPASLNSLDLDKILRQVIPPHELLLIVDA